MKNKSNFIMLVVSLLLTVAVCCAASYAWFTSAKTAKAQVEMNVLSFEFDVSGTNSDGVLSISPNVPMYPGQKFTAELKLTNGQSEKVTPAIYDISVVDRSEHPSNMIWKFGSNSNGASNTDVTTEVNNKQNILLDQTLAPGKTTTYYLYGEWVYKDNDTANQEDMEFQKNYSKITITLKVNAEQG